MVGIKRTSSEYSAPSVSRTYVAVVSDVVCPNGVRFVKFKLPDGFDNITRNARYYYESIKLDQALRVLDCVSFEDYMEFVSDAVNEAILEEPIKIKETPKEKQNDLKRVTEMLDAYNDDILYPQGKHQHSYPDILRYILSELHTKMEMIKAIERVFNSPFTRGDK
jgi:hypothetical protein